MGYKFPVKMLWKKKKKNHVKNPVKFSIDAVYLLRITLCWKEQTLGFEFWMNSQHFLGKAKYFSVCSSRNSKNQRRYNSATETGSSPSLQTMKGTVVFCKRKCVTRVNNHSSTLQMDKLRPGKVIGMPLDQSNTALNPHTLNSKAWFW